MNTITFSEGNFKKIMDCCGAVVAGKAENRKSLSYICLDMECDKCTAVGLDGYKMMKVVVPCTMEDKTKCRVMIKPVKIPNDANVIKLRVDDDRIEIDFHWYNSSIGMVVQPAIDEKFGDYPDYEKILPDVSQRQEFEIAVNPKYMIDCMKAMKDCSSVTLHFGNALQGFLITPNRYNDDGCEVGLLLPMRINA